MRIRSITIGAPVSYPVAEKSFHTYGQFQARARQAFEAARLDVQTVRLATQPFPEILAQAGPDAALPFARQMEALCRAHDIDYCSIGPVTTAQPGTGPDNLAYIDAIPALIQQTETVFASIAVTARASGINLTAIARAARIVNQIAHATPDGFGNLRLAILANCDPGSPFFPVAFHRGPTPSFSIATEAADLAVEAFTGAATLEEARASLRQAVEETAQAITTVAHKLQAELDLPFAGIDFSMAPYPETARSIGHAIEALGVTSFGGSGTLFAVALITSVLREARFPRCGFSGLFLPVLEDATLAQRSAEGRYTLDSLLLYSTVCGTGLDTIPLPGDVSDDEIAAILLDVATLALVADKPLTARLMPIPGKRAGETTEFDFPYFANAAILETKGSGVPRILANNSFYRLIRPNAPAEGE